MNTIKTKWFDNISKDCPLSEYPRPQLVRENWMCLNGQFDYSITSENAEKPERT